MAEFRELIFTKAFKVIPGIAYNQTLQEYYDRGEITGVKPLFYELVMPEEGTWEQFRDKTYPLFARYLRYKFINPVVPAGVIVAVFFKDHCYLLEGREFVNLFCEMEKLDLTAFHSLVIQWLKE